VGRDGPLDAAGDARSVFDLLASGRGGHGVQLSSDACCMMPSRASGKPTVRVHSPTGVYPLHPSEIHPVDKGSQWGPVGPRPALHRSSMGSVGDDGVEGARVDGVPEFPERHRHVPPDVLGSPIGGPSPGVVKPALTRLVVP